MSDGRAGLFSAIRTRLVGDNGTGGLFGSPQLITNVYSVRAPQASNVGGGAAAPYILLVPVAGTEEKVFSTATYSINHIVQVSIFTNADSDWSVSETIASRVRARLDRWQPTVTGWTVSQLLREDGQLFEDEGLYHQIETYRAYMALGS